MLNSLKDIVKRTMPDYVNGYRLYRDLVRNRDSYLHSTGWLQSIDRGQPVDFAGEPVPWMNYAVVQLLASRAPADAVMFEYGSGNSTTFWAKRVARVFSLEYDKAWFDRVAQALPSNASLQYCEQDRDGAYCRSVAGPGLPFDMVVVDGRDRVNCVKQATQHLSSRGIVVLDDSSRPKYSEAFAFMQAAGFSALPIQGLKPTGLGMDETTIFYRAGNCLGL